MSPQYSYKCPECGMTTTRTHKMGEAPATVQVELHYDECGDKPELIRVWTPPNIHGKAT